MNYKSIACSIVLFSLLQVSKSRAQDITLEADSPSPDSYFGVVDFVGDRDGSGFIDLLVPDNTLEEIRLIDFESRNVLHTFVPPGDGRFFMREIGKTDFNGDMVTDFVFGAPQETVDEVYKAGRLYIYSGAPPYELLESFSSPSPQVTGSFGASALLIELNDDEHMDVIVGASTEFDGSGRIWAFDGETKEVLWNTGNPDGGGIGSFGAVIKEHEDLTSDGTPEIIVSAPQAAVQPPLYNEDGALYIFNGATGEQVDSIYFPASDPSSMFAGFGRSVAVINDISGNGVPDIATTAYGAVIDDKVDAGAVYYFEGQTFEFLRRDLPPNPTESGLFSFSLRKLSNPYGNGIEYLGVTDRVGDGNLHLINSQTGEVKFTMNPPGPEATRLFGRLTDDEDINGDGLDDLIISDTGYHENRGRTLIYTSKGPKIGSPTSLSFGQREIDSGPGQVEFLTVTNDGLDTLNFTGNGVEIDGIDASQFVFSTIPDITGIPALSERSFEIQFDPSSVGEKTAELLVTTDDINSPTLRIDLSGEGIDDPDFPDESLRIY